MSDTMTESDKAADDGATGGLLPITSWAPHYKRSWLRGDLIAGLAVAALVVPKSLGYAGIAGVPIVHGLYAAAAGAIVYALFGTCRQIATGPSSALAAVAGSAVTISSLGEDEAVTLVAAITLVSGVLYAIFALFKMGWVSMFLSKPVVTGFLFGAAIEVVIGELPKLTGTSAEGINAFQKLSDWFASLGDINYTTLLVGLVALGIIVGIRFAPVDVPGALVLVVGGLIVSQIADLEGAGVALVGDVPRGLASPALPDIGFMLDNWALIGPAALGIMLIGFSQTAADARAFASKYRYQIDIDQESVAQAASNLTAGVFQGIPVSTSLSASSLNDQSGARTPVASLITGAIVLATLFFLAPLFSGLPKPVLAAIIIDAVVFGMMDVKAMKRLWRIARFDFWIAMAALVAVLASGVLAGVMVGVLLSLGWLVYINATPNIPTLGRLGRSRVYVNAQERPDCTQTEGVLIVEFDGGLFFGNADALEDRLRTLVGSGRIHTVIISLRSVNFIDSHGSDKLNQIVGLADTYGIDLRLTEIKSQVRQTLEMDGVIDRLGPDHVYDSIFNACSDHLDGDEPVPSAVAEQP